MNAPRQGQFTKTISSAQSRQHLPLVLWRNIFVVVDDGRLELDDINDIAQCVRQLGEQHPGGVGGVTVIPANGSPPSESHRLAIKRAYHLVSHHLKAMCWMVEGQGFRAATVRASLAGLRLLLQPRFPTKIAASLDEALPWLSAQLGSSTTADLPEGIATVRSTLNKLVATRSSLSPR
jgi:hypothetical protein